jgi:hypothetical protein
LAHPATHPGHFGLGWVFGGVLLIRLCHSIYQYFKETLLFCNGLQKPAVKWYNFGTARAKKVFFKISYVVTLTHKGLHGNMAQAPLYQRGV